MNKKHEFTMNIGLPSIMLIFTVLCLISFGVLSLVSANTDKNLSLKVLERSTAYYNACNNAEEMLCEVDAKLHNAFRSSHNYDEYMELISDIPCSYTYTISDIQYLDVSLSYIYPQSESDSLYQITSWKVVTTDDLDYDTGLHLIEIEDIEQIE